jgi:hypothetical protein
LKEHYGIHRPVYMPAVSEESEMVKRD